MKADVNYLYILFAIAYVIYSIIKAGKKVSKNRPPITKQPSSGPIDQQPAKSPHHERTSGDDFKKMLEELLGVPDEKVPEQYPDTYQDTPQQEVIAEKPRPAKGITSVPKKAKQAVYKSKSEESTLSSGTAHFVSPPEVTGSTPVQSIVLEEEASHKYDFDIRQAIIYSEILKRPQY